MSTTIAPSVSRPREGLRTQVRVDISVLVPAAIGVWLVMCGVGYLLTRPLTRAGFTTWESSADTFFAAHRSAGWNTMTNIASLAGDTPTIIAVAALSFVALRFVTHRWRESILVAVTMLGEVTIFLATTVMIDRPRPTVPHLDGSPPTSSFPSGHTAASTAMYGLLAIIAASYATRAITRALPIVIVAGIVLTIGTSRLYRGMHYPSDVLGGVLLGLLWLAATTMVILHGHRQDPAPLARNPGP